MDFSLARLSGKEDDEEYEELEAVLQSQDKVHQSSVPDGHP